MATLDEIVAAYPTLPVIVYTTLTPAAMRQVVRLARVGTAARGVESVRR